MLSICRTEIITAVDSAGSVLAVAMVLGKATEKVCVVPVTEAAKRSAHLAPHATTWLAYSRELKPPGLSTSTPLMASAFLSRHFDSVCQAKA